MSAQHPTGGIGPSASSVLDHLDDAGTALRLAVDQAPDEAARLLEDAGDRIDWAADLIREAQR